MIKKNKEIKKANLKMEKNIDEVIKHFELEDNIREFIENAIIKEKKYHPSFNIIAKEIIKKEINKMLKTGVLKILIEDVVSEVVSDIVYKEFSEKTEELKEEFINAISEI